MTGSSLHTRFFSSALVLLLMSFFISPTQAQEYDLVIKNGRVMDPETRTDKVMNVGISAGSIVALSEKEMSAKQVLDASGLVVAPGFIDVHSHTPTLIGQHLGL